MSFAQSFNQQFINGQWVKGSSDKIVKNTNPYTHQPIDDIQGASQQDVDAAYQAAQLAFKSWQKTTVSERQALIERIIAVISQHREALVDWLINEAGSSRLKANIEVDAALGISKASLEYAHAVNDVLNLKPLHEGQVSQVFHKALGVITVISPWNFPFHLSMRSVIPAIALGNTVVLKPASDTPVTGGLIIAKIFELADAPAGLLNVIVGAGSEIGDYVVEHDASKFISFTGSTQVGKRVAEKAMSARLIKRVGLELGGNAPLVILDDADLDLAVNLTVMGRFLHQGQICMSTNRVIIDEKIYDQYLEKLGPALAQIKVGNPANEDTLVGPIINTQQTDNLRRIIQQAQHEGAVLFFDGGIEGNLVGPHVFINVEPDFAVAKEESFGPVLPILKARDEAHALELANDTEFGLSSAVCTSNHERGVKFALGIEAGMSHINEISVADHPVAPFGGEKNSGLGRFNGQWIIEEYTTTHWITAQK
ncbi:aldehyde dehydrogenase family protein [Acinetobacter sp.]|uniref:aldehyde dehydrogenase family protein n=1 Tax=Acinetobacter sp. TaxID=472 RepID=UPI0031DCF412